MCLFKRSNTILIFLSFFLSMCAVFFSSFFSLADVCQGCINQIENCEQEVQALKRQLELAHEKINELEVIQ